MCEIQNVFFKIYLFFWVLQYVYSWDNLEIFNYIYLSI